MATAKTTTTPPVRTCRFGEGAYGSPADSKRCGKPIFELDKHPGHQLCEKHIPVWNAIAKTRAAAKAPAKPKDSTPKSAGTSKATTPKPKARVAKSGPVVKAQPKRPMLPPIARVVNNQPGAMISQLVALEPTEDADANS